MVETLAQQNPDSQMTSPTAFGVASVMLGARVALHLVAAAYRYEAHNMVTHEH